MSLSTTVPADIDADSMADLFEDCREVAGVLGVIPTGLRLPAARRPSTPVEAIDVRELLDGYGDYGC